MDDLNSFNTILNLMGSEPIYIVAQCDGGVGPIYAFDSMSELKDHLEEVDFYTEEVSVLYGSCIPATAIPENTTGVEMYLVVENDDLNGYVIPLELDDDEERVTDVISVLINGSPDQDEGSQVTMDNLFILYGTELTIRITVLEDDVDSDLVETYKNMKYKADELSSCT